MADLPPRRLNRSRLALSFELLREAVATGELPVGLLAVADRREIVECRAFSPDGDFPADHIFLIASLSKPIVATAVMRLVEQGRLLIEDPVANYIPEFATQGKRGITLWNLLTHTSGMSDDYMSQVAPPATPEKDLNGALATTLRFEPGTYYQYCNSSFRILGELIARASGKSYQDYLAREIFDPAGMKETSFRPGPEKRPRVVPVSDFPQVPGGFESYVSAELPSGGLFSTAADLVAFGQSFLNGGMGRDSRILSPVTVEAMTRLQTRGIPAFEPGESPSYALGWEKAVPEEVRLLSESGYGHGGMTGTYLWVEPRGGIVVVFLTNRVTMDRRVRKKIVNSVLACLE